MPIIRVDMLAGRTSQQKSEIAEVFTRELSRIAKCGIDDVQVVFNEVERRNWAVGGKLSEDVAHASSV